MIKAQFLRDQFVQHQVLNWETVILEQKVLELASKTNYVKIIIKSKLIFLVIHWISKIMRLSQVIMGHKIQIHFILAFQIIQMQITYSNQL